ncbi:MAG: hypothetical protein M3348_17275 [Acidobacteriota bacterium]|nr:hypothetical protein [Acidobacteriota bacterium]
MTNEEIQRVMEFIIKRQESFAEGMEQMRESHARAEERVSRLEIAAVHLYNETTELKKAQRVLAEKMAELAEAQAHTDRRVNALIDVIEQWRNGKSQS